MKAESAWKTGESSLPSRNGGGEPTLWGLRPAELHDRFWASFGICPVRRGEGREVETGPRLYLLTDANVLLTFQLDRVLTKFEWPMTGVAFFEMRDERELEYREFAQSDEDSRFRRFQRVYSRFDTGRVTVALTPEREVAEAWRKAADLETAMEGLRGEEIALEEGEVEVVGRLYEGWREEEVAAWVRDIVAVWTRPDFTVGRAVAMGDGVWADRESTVQKGARIFGSVWIGVGRTVGANASVAGPAVIWDEKGTPQERPGVRWEGMRPRALASSGRARPRVARAVGYPGKRLFDVVCALVGLALTLPLYPFIMLWILIEDGWPCFFGHERETVGARRFRCVKFRTMRKDAEAIKERLAAENQADGPQFFIENDPRLLRSGLFLRKTNLDELPQFWNVLAGHMSMVGPRPSPFEENQYCPPWREARLSVRPGITGLWQVKRSREPGLDFQEWIRYDLEYNERMSPWMDLKILWQTVWVVVGGK